MNSDASALLGVQFPVLDKGYVELQDVMGDDLAIVNAARVSFLGESKGPEQDARLLNYLMRNKHTSCFEQVEFKFRIKAPVVVWWQQVRHRTAHLNLQSGRYTPFAEDEFYIPSEWRRQSSDNKQGSDGALSPQLQEWFNERYLDLLDETFLMYSKALDAGMAKEQARLFLMGWGSYYTGVWKIDAHNLMHFLTLRNEQHAQHEIREFARVIETEIFAKVLPITYQAWRNHE